MNINTTNQQINKDTYIKTKKDSIDVQGQKVGVNVRDEGWRKMEYSRFVPDDKMDAILKLVKMAEESTNKVMSYDGGNNDSIKEAGYVGLGEDTGYVPTTAAKIDPETGEVHARIRTLSIDEESRTIVSDSFTYEKHDDGEVHIDRLLQTDSFTEKNEKRTESIIKEGVTYNPQDPEMSFYSRNDHSQTKTKNQSSFERQKRLTDHKLIDGFLGDKKDPNKKIKHSDFY